MSNPIPKTANNEEKKEKVIEKVYQIPSDDPLWNEEENCVSPLSVYQLQSNTVYPTRPPLFIDNRRIGTVCIMGTTTNVQYLKNVLKFELFEGNGVMNIEFYNPNSSMAAQLTYVLSQNLSFAES